MAFDAVLDSKRIWGQTSADPYLYYIGQREKLMLVVTYVYDILIASRSARSIDLLGKFLSSKFELKDLGQVEYCLGIEFSRNNGKILLQQLAYVNDLVKRFNISDCKSVGTPIEVNVKLRKATDPPNESRKLPFREFIEALTFSSMTTTPDISYAGNYLSQFNNCYDENHWRQVTKQEYLLCLGMARTAEVQRDAKIGEVEAQRDAEIKKSLANEIQKEAELANQIKIEEARRNFELKRTLNDAEVQTKNAESELAFELQAAKINQNITAEKIQIDVIERKQQITVAEQEITRQEKYLDAKVKRLAEAEKYKLEKIAQATRKKVLLEAEAQAEAVKLKGEARAFAIITKAKAEAEAMTKKAEAWNEYQKAATVSMMLDILPDVIKEVATPISETRKITMVSSGNSQIGAAKLTDEILTITTKVPDLVKSMTGIDIAKVTTSIH